MALMDFDDYQSFTDTTAKYPDMGNNIVYPVLGLVGESGEVAEKVKKTIRDHHGEWSPDRSLELIKELGDVLWYIARVARELKIPLSTVAELNMLKLQSRKLRDRISGSGDNR